MKADVYLCKISPFLDLPCLVCTVELSRGCGGSLGRRYCRMPLVVPVAAGTGVS